jgi:DNA-binding transcriptional regulator GbsR (MarR family)
MTPHDSSDFSPVVRRFIEEAGKVTQSFGVGRVLGQIYAYLYFSERPRSLSDMQRGLGISKGSASMGVRQLEQWEAVRKVWVRGDRKDYYEANDWFGNIVKHAALDTVVKKLSSSAAVLGELETELKQDPNGWGGAFVRGRIKHLRRFQQRAQKLLGSPLLRMLLK